MFDPQPSDLFAVGVASAMLWALSDEPEPTLYVCAGRTPASATTSTETYAVFSHPCAELNLSPSDQSIPQVFDSGKALGVGWILVMPRAGAVVCGSNPE